MDKEAKDDKEEKGITELSSEKQNESKLAKQPDQNLCRIFRQYFREYCLNSSLHGIRYLGEKGRTKTERVMWFLFLIASIFLCSQLIKKTWIKWNSMPVIIGLAERPTSVWQVPFPAVTICPEMKIRQTKYNYTAYYYKYKNSNLTADEKKQFLDISVVCNNYLHTYGANTINQSAIDLIHDVAPQLDEFLWKCLWPHTSTWNNKCHIFFRKSITKEGLCYTYNTLDRTEILNKEAQNEHYLNYNVTSEWSLDNGYKVESNIYDNPKRAVGSGIEAGLTILLQSYTQDYDKTCNVFQGFKIFLHSPAEIPQVDQQHIRGSWNQTVSIRVEPNIMTTSDGLKNYHPSRRNCYFSGEKTLRYFKIYSQQNCKLECISNFTLSECGCVTFYMPHATGTPICGLEIMNCVNRIQRNYIEREIKSEYMDPENKYKTSPNCNCLPGCSSLTYNSDVTLEEYKLLELYRYQPGLQLSRVHIYFKDTQFMTWRRNEIFDQTDFLASCGGLLGLFLGFSFLSLVEIAYFLTLRLFCNVNMHARRLWNAVKIDPLTG